MYLLRVVDWEQVNPNANIPTVEFPTAEPWLDAAVADAADALVEHEYVYLLRMVDPVQDTKPNANMPFVEFPAADPNLLAQLAASAPDTTHPEYVYVSRVVELEPLANIPTVELPVAEDWDEVADDEVAVVFTQPE